MKSVCKTFYAPSSLGKTYDFCCKNLYNLAEASSVLI